MINSPKDHNKKNKRTCYTLEMDWTTDPSFESGKKFCPTATTEATPPSCKDDVFTKKSLTVFMNNQTSTWHACRDLCNTNNMCEYFKWKVRTT